MKYLLQHIDIEINHRCNLACRHCSAIAVKGKMTEELSVDKIIAILSSAKMLGLKKVGLTGGEPLIDIPKLEKLVDFCNKNLSVPIHTHTNGTLVTEDMCRSKGVLSFFESISVTFLGGDAETHDYMTKTKGSFDKTINGAKIIAKAGLPLTCYYIPTHGICTTYKKLTPKLHKLGVKRIRAMALAPSGRARLIYGQTAPSSIELNQFEKDLLEAGKLLNLHIEAGNCTRLSMPMLAVLNGHDNCMSGINRVHISSKGDVFPCTAASGVQELCLGNLNTCFDIENIWRNSETLKLIREIHYKRLAECNICKKEPSCRSGCIVNTIGTLAVGEKLLCPLINTEVIELINIPHSFFHFF